MIFCVEDDASIRDIEVYALHSTGFQARGFADGESFWKALEQELPSLVVLDVMLPGIDGVTLLTFLSPKADTILFAAVFTASIDFNNGPLVSRLSPV